MNEYHIIIPRTYTASEWITAYELAHFMTEMGHSTDVTTMGTGVGKTIFIGNAKGLDINCYAMSDMHLSAGSAYGYERLLAEIKARIEDGELSESIELSGDLSDILEAPQIYTQKRSGDARVMFFNVFNNIYKVDKMNTPNLTSGPIALRHLIEKELIDSYLPDVLCMQEYQKWFREGWEGSPAMTEYLSELGYSEASTETFDGISNATPVFYRPDSLELIECGYHVYSGDNDGGTKSITWARLRVRKNGKRFVAMSTHFMWNADWMSREEAVEVRKTNAREALALRDAISAGDPVIFGGDLNCNSASKEWKMLVDGGFSYAKSIAEVFNTSCGWKNYAIYNSDINVYTSIPVPHDGNGLDHVFVWGNVKVDAFMTVTDKLALLSSDHCPKFADITLN